MILPSEIPLIILGVPVHAVTNTQALEACLRHLKRGKPGYVATPNLDFVMQAGRDPELHRILSQADLVIADGMPLVWLSRDLGPALPERVAGSDLVLTLAEAAARESYRVFHLGGAPGVPEKAGEVLKNRYPGFQLAGAYSPRKADLLDMNHGEILTRIREASPDILYVAFGAPKQEKWINMHYRDWQVGLALGIGGSLDFLAGTQKRAPKWMQKTGTEWIWRLGTDPKRLWKRYGSNLLFLFQARRSVKRILSHPEDPQPATLPPAAYEDQVLCRPWQPCPAPDAAANWINTLHETPQPAPLLLDLSACTALSSLELGTLLTLSRDRPLLLTGVSGRLRAWLDFNLISPGCTFIDAQTDWAHLLADLAPTATRVESTATTLRISFPKELTAANLETWRSEITPLLDARGPEITDIILDAASLKFLDSAGLGFLMGLKQKLAQQNTRLQLESLTGPPLTTLKLARVEKILLSNKSPDPSAAKK